MCFILQTASKNLIYNRLLLLPFDNIVQYCPMIVKTIIVIFLLYFPFSLLPISLEDQCLPVPIRNRLLLIWIHVRSVGIWWCVCHLFHYCIALHFLVSVNTYKDRIDTFSLHPLYMCMFWDITVWLYSCFTVCCVCCAINLFSKSLLNTIFFYL